MSDPLFLLLIGTVILTLAIFLFWPSKGAYFLWKKLKLDSERVLLEDALKHIYACEYEKVGCTSESISGALSISSEKGKKLRDNLARLKLIEFGTKEVSLTGEGRRYALRIIRSHRLWEKYLSEETSFSEKDWHNEAEIKEHSLSEKEVNELAAKIGNPLLDPHGDPIPSAEGEMPEEIGIPLTELEEKQPARIVHIEDEPPIIYSQIIAEGIYVGMQVRKVNMSSEKVVFEADGEEHILAPAFASNITARVIETDEVIDEFKTLASLKKGESGTVKGISKQCRGSQRRRLLDFGIVPGSIITNELESVGNDPIAYKIRGATIALRKTQTEQIFLETGEVSNG